jgi:hypothetical protein
LYLFGNNKKRDTHKSSSGDFMILTWQKQWRRPFESNWSLFEKIKQLNNISGNDLLIKFNDQYQRGIRSIRNIHTLKGFNLELIRSTLGIDLMEVKGSMLKFHKILNHQAKPLYPLYGFHTHLAFCEQCLTNSYHSYIHQFKLITDCPFHLIPLKSKCPNCHKHIFSNILLNNMPFCCTCKEKIVSSTSTSSWESWEFDPIIKDRDVLEWIKTIGELSATLNK